MLIKPCVYFYKRYPATCKAFRLVLVRKIFFGYYTALQLSIEWAYFRRFSVWYVFPWAWLRLHIKFSFHVKYKRLSFQLVFYLEACNSGSMFDKDLDTSYNMYITTAANAHESSYACYYDKVRKAYLGDRYSVTWMEDSDKVSSGKWFLLDPTGWELVE